MMSSPSGSQHYEFQIGQEMQGYRITRQLGQGTFGRVLEGQKKGKKYAIKVIRPVQRYIDSAKIQKGIIKNINKRDVNDEEGIVRYKQSFYHRGYYCLVFQTLGLSLYQLIKKNQFRGFPLKLVQKIFRQTLKSIGFMHRLGYTHTDLKPQNILLQSQALKQFQKGYYLPQSSKVKIIDLGGATLFSQIHSPIICTRQYRPPEVILQSGQWNELADVWSIGCIIVELYTGQLLFPIHSDEQHLAMIQKNSGKFPHWMISKSQCSHLRRIFQQGSIEEQPRMRTIEDSCNEPSQFLDLLKQCLEIDPNKRINCANALRHPFFQLSLKD